MTTEVHSLVCINWWALFLCIKTNESVSRLFFNTQYPTSNLSPQFLMFVKPYLNFSLFCVVHLTYKKAYCCERGGKYFFFLILQFAVFFFFVVDWRQWFNANQHLYLVVRNCEDVRNCVSWRWPDLFALLTPTRQLRIM